MPPQADSDADTRSEFEHLRDLCEASARVDKGARLMFLESDGMFHPFRVWFFRQLLTAGLANRTSYPN